MEKVGYRIHVMPENYGASYHALNVNNTSSELLNVHPYTITP